MLASGCVCCTMRSDLEDTLRGLLARRDRGEVPPFRRVLVETTGLADPAPIVQLLLNNPLLSHFVRLDTDRDDGRCRQRASGSSTRMPEAVKQAAIADRLLLTKTDLAERRMRPRGCERGSRGSIPARDRQHRAPRRDRAGPAVRRGAVRSGAQERRTCAAGSTRTAYDAPDDHDHRSSTITRTAHDRDIHAFCLTFDDPLDWMTVSDWLGELRRARGEDLLRVKGILNLAGEDAPVAIHGVHHVFHPPVLLNAWPDDDRRSRIVFITRGLDQTAVEESWRVILPEVHHPAASV